MSRIISNDGCWIFRKKSSPAWSFADSSSNPISIGVTGLTVDAGLSTFPTIQRRYFNGVNSELGLRNTGAIRVVTGL